MQRPAHAPDLSGTSGHAHPRPWRSVALAALVGLAAGAASAATAPAHVQMSASASNLRYTLVDLDPLDGVAPSVTFDSPQQFSLSNSLTVDRPGQPRVAWSSAPVVSAPTTIDRDLGTTAQTTIAYDGAGVQTGGFLSNAGVSSGRFTQRAELDDVSYFTLSANTSITFSLDVAVDLVLGGTGNNMDGWGSAQLMLAFYDPETFRWQDAGSGVGGFVGKGDFGEFVPSVQQSRTANATVYNSGDSSGQGYLDYYAVVEGTVYPVAQVPEPGEWAMLGVGLGLLGWRARRKKT